MKQRLGGTFVRGTECSMHRSGSVRTLVDQYCRRQVPLCRPWSANIYIQESWLDVEERWLLLVPVGDGRCRCHKPRRRGRIIVLGGEHHLT